jgi:hypothetical protein
MGERTQCVEPLSQRTRKGVGRSGPPASRRTLRGRELRRDKACPRVLEEKVCPTGAHGPEDRSDVSMA